MNNIGELIMQTSAMCRPNMMHVESWACRLKLFKHISHTLNTPDDPSFFVGGFICVLGKIITEVF